MTPPSHSEQIARQSRSNFYPAFAFLPKDQRKGLAAVYAVSRLIDDAVDQAVSSETARHEISLWRQRIWSCYQDGLPDEHPLLGELSETIRHFDIPYYFFEDLLKGVEMDLVKKRYETFGDLEIYCYHVAGTIGLICNQIFGIPKREYEEYALLLGTAFQLTNILRDIGSDLKQGRIYIPLEDFRRFRYTPEDLQNQVRDHRFFSLMKFEVARAHGYFEQAEKVLTEKQRRQLVSAEVMRRFYFCLLKKIERQKFPSLKKRVSLSLWQKAWILGRSWVRWKCSLTLQGRGR